MLGLAAFAFSLLSSALNVGSKGVTGGEALMGERFARGGMAGRVLACAAKKSERSIFLCNHSPQIRWKEKRRDGNIHVRLGGANLGCDWERV